MSFISTDKYIKIPSVTTTQRNALTAVNGMVVYDTDLNLFYKYENGAWSSFAGGGSSAWGSITGTLSAQTDLQNALNAKEDTITAGTTSQYWRGDKSWQTLNKSAVGLGNVDNTSDANKPVSNATQQALDQEATTRLNADTALSSDILAEASARSSADTNILSFVAATYATLASLTSYLTTAAAATTYQVILSAANFGAFINGLTDKTTPVDADAVSLMDSADSNNSKKLTWANIKATLKTYFDTLYSSPIYSPTAGNTIAEIIDDFAYVTPVGGSTYSSYAMSHTGNNVTSITNLISTMTNQLGVVSCQYNGVGDNVWSMPRVAALGQGELCFGCYMRRPNDSGAANQSNLRFGLRLGAGDGTDGVFFKLNEATNSDRWQCITRASSVSTTSNTSVTTAKSSWVRLFIVVNAAGTEAKFYIDGTLVATHNTNMPAAGTALTGILNLERTVISSLITWLIDYFYIKQTFTTPR